jgi:hypothetical protein
MCEHYAREGVDRADIDALIRDFFDFFDNRSGVVSDESRLIDLFAEKAVIVKSVDGKCESFTPTEFVAPRVALLRNGNLRDFHEWEETCSTEIVGDTAVRSSRYFKSGLLDGKDVRGSGTKFFQLAKSAGRWRIVSLIWTDDPA